ncbi:SORF2 protein [Gallid alphaherpesvirus 3]|uniref:Uncharacterized protein n=2 Tax=Gallid alphaherpesvirus 3 TaxID=35250 RepID=O89262_9ALPH|nr:protein S2 [Gallid alphaherpesvirus 3]BAA32004.1 unnamed protein product [Marek's disease virus serotype 2 MDV2]BAB16583.1 SORF2 protein [Gallid alphaherpesvirus 3]
MTHAKSVTAQRRPEGNSASGKAHGKTLARLCNSASPRVEPTGLSSDGYRGQLVVGAGGGGVCVSHFHPRRCRRSQMWAINASRLKKDKLEGHPQ